MSADLSEYEQYKKVLIFCLENELLIPLLDIINNNKAKLNICDILKAYVANKSHNLKFYVDLIDLLISENCNNITNDFLEEYKLYDLFIQNGNKLDFNSASRGLCNCYYYIFTINYFPEIIYYKIIPYLSDIVFKNISLFSLTIYSKYDDSKSKIYKEFFKQFSNNINLSILTYSSEPPDLEILHLLSEYDDKIFNKHFIIKLQSCINVTKNIKQIDMNYNNYLSFKNSWIEKLRLILSNIYDSDKHLFEEQINTTFDLIKNKYKEKLLYDLNLLQIYKTDEEIIDEYGIDKINKRIDTIQNKLSELENPSENEI